MPPLIKWKKRNVRENPKPTRHCNPDVGIVILLNGTDRGLDPLNYSRSP